MSTKRLLITGASGNLGYPLSRLAVASYEVQGTYLHNSHIGGGSAVQIDLRDRRKVSALFETVRPQAVIHTAGSDRSPDMKSTIEESAQHIAEAAARHRCRLVALSTDVIFDGTQAPYPEEAIPTPVHSYGIAKSNAERIIQQIYPAAVCVRTSLIYGFKRENRQLGWMLDRIEGGETLHLFTDEFRQPIWAWNLAEALLELVANDYPGVLNIAGGERLSRFEFGRQLLDAVEQPYEGYLEPALAANVAPNRPRDCTLALKKARNLLTTPLLTLPEAVKVRSRYS